MTQLFNVEFAAKYGLAEAVVFQVIARLCFHSKANNRNFHDGRYWTFNSIRALRDYFPYLSRNKMTGVMSSLVNSGLVMIGNYNDSPLDQTKWYALTDEGERLFYGVEKCVSPSKHADCPEIRNAFPQNGHPPAENQKCISENGEIGEPLANTGPRRFPQNQKCISENGEMSRAPHAYAQKESTSTLNNTTSTLCIRRGDGGVGEEPSFSTQGDTPGAPTDTPTATPFTLSADGQVPPPAAKRFRKPTVDEVRDYAEANKLDVDANGFFDFYEAKGWLVGRAAMKDWRAAVRNWARMDYGHRPGNRASADQGRNVRGLTYSSQKELEEYAKANPERMF